MSERGAGNQAPIAAAGAIIAYDGVTRIGPAAEPFVMLPSSLG